MKILMNINTEKQGVELRFSVKPAKEVCAELKAQGFHFADKGDPRWYAKQTEQTLAFATALSTSADKIASAPKTEAKSEPKAKAPKQTKAKAEKKADTFKNSGRGDKKERYEVKGKNGTRTVRGYKFACTLNGKTVVFGTHKEKDDTWTVTDIKSGLSIANFPKCYIAIASTNAEITGKVIAKMGY